MLVLGHTLKPGLAWPGLIGLAWPQNWPGLTFGLKIGLAPNFGLASNFGLAPNLASAKIFGLNFIFIFSLPIYKFIDVLLISVQFT